MIFRVHLIIYICNELKRELMHSNMFLDLELMRNVFFFIFTLTFISFYQQNVQNLSQQNTDIMDINLDCGRPVTFSFYDDLIGISLRYSHPLVPDLEVYISLLGTIKFEIVKKIFFSIKTGSNSVSQK